MKPKESQTRKIARHLLNGHAITPIQALRLYGCMRLASRIYDIKNGRFGIVPFNPTTKMIYKHGKKWASYSYKRPTK